jgi:hypothetical protein
MNIILSLFLLIFTLTGFCKPPAGVKILSVTREEARGGARGSAAKENFKIRVIANYGNEELKFKYIRLGSDTVPVQLVNSTSNYTDGRFSKNDTLVLGATREIQSQ